MLLTGGQSGAPERDWAFADRQSKKLKTGSANILIAGVGNLLMGDDGIGVHALQELQKAPIPGVTMIEMGTAILHGLSFVETAARVLVIDAARGGKPPGTIYFFEAGETGSLPATSSIHALGLREAMRFLSVRPPPPVSIIGVEPQTLDYGMELSAPVQAALPRVIALARTTVAEWLGDNEPAHHSIPHAELSPALP